jgi:hypothetical protein
LLEEARTNLKAGCKFFETVSMEVFANFGSKFSNGIEALPLNEKRA